MEGHRGNSDLGIVHGTADQGRTEVLCWGLGEMMDFFEQGTPVRDTFWGLKLTYQRPDRKIDGEMVTPEELYIYLYKVTWCYAIRTFEESESDIDDEKTDEKN